MDSQIFNPQCNGFFVDDEGIYVFTVGLVLGVMGQGPSFKGSFC